METGKLYTFCSGLKFSQHDRKRHRHSEGVTLGKWVSRRVCSDRYTVLREKERVREREMDRIREKSGMAEKDREIQRTHGNTEEMNGPTKPPASAAASTTSSHLLTSSSFFHAPSLSCLWPGLV